MAVVWILRFLGLLCTVLKIVSEDTGRARHIREERWTRTRDISGGERLAFALPDPMLLGV